jgi:hypothetical protein
MHRAIGIVNLELAGKVWRHHGGEVTFILPSPLWPADENGTQSSRRRYKPIHMDEDNDGE